ncbi:hypothetical protein MJO28_002949 [Puccinia striiformis f. sp. tritici]|uniref:Uncharacterized protein n=1 Tax=Puccinia striiformis f. sp. tritici TaxID=168172 RepID=A0ACC0ESH4_9BASI|nr:hypothetical protein MJO28_002949 [Puccinia striiformis f. sp. tritici]KAI7964914.1 hypothetical protein MJO29_003012 [Puccinia striiformis f. sp. tritici]
MPHKEPQRINEDDIKRSQEKFPLLLVYHHENESLNDTAISSPAPPKANCIEFRPDHNAMGALLPILT